MHKNKASSRFTLLIFDFKQRNSKIISNPDYHAQTSLWKKDQSHLMISTY